MSEQRKAVGLSLEQLEQANGGASVLGVYRPGFQHKRESLRFFRACVGDSDMINAYRGEYMNTYSWASMTESILTWSTIK